MTRPLLWVVAVAVMATGCSAVQAPTVTPTMRSADDKLAAIVERGALILSTDIAYAPQSFAVEGADRPDETRCAANQLTAPEVAGYDADTGKLVAEALGVEPCFVTPTWTEITAGNWGDRWDISYGSGGINADRMTRLYMTQPYYATPQRFYVSADSDIRTAAELAGHRIGVCASCTHELYLRGELQIPGQEISPAVTDPEIVLFDVEPPGLAAVVDGDIDAFLCAEPVGEQAIADGLALRPLAEPAFEIYATGFVDRGSTLDETSFVARINDIVAALHADGRLTTLSEQYFGTDYSAAAAGFDLSGIGQEIP